MKKKARKRQSKWQGKNNKHHIKCKSRGGKDYDNVVKWDVRFHRNWHFMFQNMTVEEIHKFIDEINKPNWEWSSHDLARLRGKLKGR